MIKKRENPLLKIYIFIKNDKRIFIYMYECCSEIFTLSNRRLSVKFGIDDEQKKTQLSVD